MGETTAIQWTGATWNPWRGCHRVSPGCAKCYMFRDQKRYGRDPNVVVRSAPATFNAPLKWTGPKKVFTCSWSDVFIEEADPWREEFWSIIRRKPDLTFQILSKRPERIRDHLPTDWGPGYPNVWLGVSVEDQAHWQRAKSLVEIPAAVRFLSCEPLLGPLQLDADTMKGIHWCIVGGESDYHPRPMDLDWARGLRDACKFLRVPFFLKQTGGSKHCECHGAWGCRLLDGRTWDEFPRG